MAASQSPLKLMLSQIPDSSLMDHFGSSNVLLLESLDFESAFLAEIFHNLFSDENLIEYDAFEHSMFPPRSIRQLRDLYFFSTDMSVSNYYLIHCEFKCVWFSSLRDGFSLLFLEKPTAEYIRGLEGYSKSKEIGESFFSSCDLKNDYHHLMKGIL